MDSLKPFDPKDVDLSLIRMVSYGGHNYALFPYIDALGAAPTFSSVGLRIARPPISPEELLELSALIKHRGKEAAWFISFNTPWLLRLSEAETIALGRSRSRQVRG